MSLKAMFANNDYTKSSEKALKMFRVFLPNDMEVSPVGGSMLQNCMKVSPVDGSMLQNCMKVSPEGGSILQNCMKVSPEGGSILQNCMEVSPVSGSILQNCIVFMFMGMNLQTACIPSNLESKNNLFYCKNVVLPKFFCNLATANGKSIGATQQINTFQTGSIMKKINSIKTSHMNNGAHFTFASNILVRAEADNTVMAKASELVGKLKAAINAEDEALNISRKSFLTDDIAQANNDRNSSYRGYRKAVKAFLYIPEADMAEAAKVLAQHIKDYRISPRDQLDKKTGLLVNFIDDLENRYSAQVAKLGLTAFVTKMKKANEQVRTSTLQRTKERMGITVGAMQNARTATDDAYRSLVRMVNALAVVYGEDDYTPFIDYVNAEILHYKREVIGQKAAASVNQTAESGNDSTPAGGTSADSGALPEDDSSSESEPSPDSGTPSGGSASPDSDDGGMA